MHLDTIEIKRISERLIALGNREKLLATYVAAETENTIICSQMGLLPHQVTPAVTKLCDDLGIEKVALYHRRLYLRAAVLYLVPPPPPSLPPPPKIQIRSKKITRQQKAEIQSMAVGFLRESQKTADPLLSAMLSAAPKVFAYAISLCRNVTHAEDLMQEGLSRGYANLRSFQPGDDVKRNMNLWLFTIVRNLYHSEIRKRRREVEDVDGVHAEKLTSPPDQIASLELKEFAVALTKLPDEQRQAVTLIGMNGLSYIEAATACGCAEGTIKSRLNRARMRLAELLTIEEGDGGPGGIFLARDSTEEVV